MTAAPVSRMTLTQQSEGKTTTRVKAVTDTPWPHVEVSAILNGVEVVLAFSAREALALSDGIAQAVAENLTTELS